MGLNCQDQILNVGFLQIFHRPSESYRFLPSDFSHESTCFSSGSHFTFQSSVHKWLRGRELLLSLRLRAHS